MRSSEERWTSFCRARAFTGRLADEGVKALVSAVSVAYPDPNHGDGTAIVTAAERTDIDELRDLRDKVARHLDADGLHGAARALRRDDEAGLKVDGFFRETLYLGDDDAMERAPLHLLDRDGRRGLPAPLLS